MAQPTIQWSDVGVRLIDQRRLPHQFKVIVCADARSLHQAIRRLSVRGAPALGAAGAFGVLLGAGRYKGNSPRVLLKKVDAAAAYIAAARPTAVNLSYGAESVRRAAHEHADSASSIRSAIRKEAKRIYEEDRSLCRRLGEVGAKLINNGTRVLTICNTGALATVDYGTALGVLFSAKKKGKKFEVYACETRPLLQGARLTTWELMRARISVTLICDSMAATLMNEGKVDIVLTGADRIAANGDVANKIGTYMLAVLAKHHKIPFYVVAPSTTLDPGTRTGKRIVIEQRPKEEVTHLGPAAVAPRGVKVYNPAFDVTPHRLITGIVTERGIRKF
jgi:methylthioribose-1-phosphate isomerase